MMMNTRLTDELCCCLELLLADRRFTTDAAELLVRVWNDALRADLERGHDQRCTRLSTHIPMLELCCFERQNELAPANSLRFIVDRERYWGFENRLNWPFGSVPDIYRIEYIKLFPAATHWELDLISEFGLRGWHLNNYLRNIRAAAVAVGRYQQWRAMEDQ